MGMKQVEKLFEYLTIHVPNTFNYYYRKINYCDMLSFVDCILKVYLDCWNLNFSCKEYVPDFTKL